MPFDVKPSLVYKSLHGEYSFAIQNKYEKNKIISAVHLIAFACVLSCR